MQLKYRGVTYEYNPQAVETITTVTTGKYRGLDCASSHATAAVAKPTSKLKYRGVAYDRSTTTVVRDRKPVMVPSLT